MHEHVSAESHVLFYLRILTVWISLVRWRGCGQLLVKWSQQLKKQLEDDIEAGTSKVQLMVYHED